MCDTATMATLLMTLSNDIETPSFRSISCRQCPVLQDIDGDIAYVLAHSTARSTEETFTDLTNVAQLSQLQQVRNKMFHHAIGAFIECEDPEGFLNDSQFKLKRRRGAKAAATTAMDIVQLFNYVCGIDSNFPPNVLANGGQPPPIVTAVARGGGNDLNDQSVTDGSTSGSLTLSSLSRSPPDTPASLGASQDIPCAQRCNDPDDPQQTGPAELASPIGSPFLEDDDGESTPLVHSSPIDLTSSVEDSLSISYSPCSNVEDLTPGGRARHNGMQCCDHGRAILDLRCTVDKIQYQLNELSKVVNEYTRRGIACNPWAGRALRSRKPTRSCGPRQRDVPISTR